MTKKQKKVYISGSRERIILTFALVGFNIHSRGFGINYSKFKMSVHKKKDIKRITTHVLKAMKQQGERIAMLTAYDYSTARILDEAGIDVLLVGDSASNVMAGHETTLPITLDQMIYHAQSVVRAVKRALIVVDLPFGSYQGNSMKALDSAIRIMKESGAHAVKLEGGEEIVVGPYSAISKKLESGKAINKKDKKDKKELATAE